jgi:hypothetical protein
MAERPLSAAEIAHAEAAGKLQDQINQFQMLLEDSSLRPAMRVAIAQQMTRAANAQHKHLHEIRQGSKRLERAATAGSPGGGSPISRSAGPSPDRRAELHAAVASSRERTRRLRAARVAAQPQEREV